MNLKRHHVLYVLLAVSLMIALLIFLTPASPSMSYRAFAPSPDVPKTSSTTQTMRFEVVTTEAQQEQGLGGRANIPENYGMLFVFPNEGKRGFWMKNMLASIDIIWLSDTGTILGIEDSVSPQTYPKEFYPASPVKYVLETRAGEMRRHAWSVGSTISLPLPYGK